MPFKAAIEGLFFDEPLLWEKSVNGRSLSNLFERDIKEYNIDKKIIRDPADLPELSELDIVRHFVRLSQYNFSIDTAFYPLGSCTMKYNPKINEKTANLKQFLEAHPMADVSLSQGCLEIIYELGNLLTKLTGLDAASSQPAAGAHGELTGMLIIKAYNEHRGVKKTKIIIPDSAHGTNPASASLCGFSPVHIHSNKNGIIDAETVLSVMTDEVAGIIITNPNTLGLFEKNLPAIAQIIHSKGGLVYCDGANLNAILGLVDFKALGVDILHINLHKTFSTPHGGGGPGAGPICVRDFLKQFLPVPLVVKDGDCYRLEYNNTDSIGKIHSFYGNFTILVRAYTYILSLGFENLRDVAYKSVLNANYIKEKLKKYYHLPYDEQCMHECVFTDAYQLKHNVTTMDIAKRLIDYGYHPPTVYFPLIVKDALMIEPTETESKQTLDDFIETLIKIASEAENTSQLLKEAPHKTKVKRIDEVFAARAPKLKD